MAVSGSTPQLLEPELAWLEKNLDRFEPGDSTRAALVLAARLSCRARTYYLDNLPWTAFRTWGVILGTFAAGAAAYQASRGAIEANNTEGGVLRLVIAAAAAAYIGKAVNDYYGVVSARIANAEECLTDLLRIVYGAQVKPDSRDLGAKFLEAFAKYPHVLASVQADRLDPKTRLVLGVMGGVSKTALRDLDAANVIAARLQR